MSIQKYTIWIPAFQTQNKKYEMICKRTNTDTVTEIHLSQIPCFCFILQSRTVWTQEAVTYMDFSGLAPGQNYCAVANFSFPTFSMAASSKSVPQCVQTSSKLGERKTEGVSNINLSHCNL